MLHCPVSAAWRFLILSSWDKLHNPRLLRDPQLLPLHKETKYLVSLQFKSKFLEKGIWSGKLSFLSHSALRRYPTVHYWSGFLTSFINRNWSETRQQTQARPYWDPCCHRRKQKQVTASLAYTLRRANRFFTWGEGPWGTASVIQPPPGGIVCRRQTLDPAFAPGSSELAVGLLGLFVSFVQNLP